MNTSRAVLLLFASQLVACGGGGSSSPSPPGPIASAAPSTAATATPIATPTPVSPVPAAEASAYALEASDIAGYTTAVAAQCPGNPNAATRFDVELLNANANYLYSVLTGKTVPEAQSLANNAVRFAVSVRRVLPGVGFMINPLYPVLVRDQADAPSWWDAATNYPIFSAYYRTLAQGLNANGIPYDVEANIIFPSYSGKSYDGVTIAQLEAGVAEDASNILTVMSPAYENVASEPLTLSENTGQASLNTVPGYAAYVGAVRSAMIVPAAATTLIGAGSADWSNPSFLSAVETVPNLAYYDEHLYPPDLLTKPGGGLTQTNDIAPSVTGKPGVITETWDEKDAGAGAAYGAADAPALEQQDTFSFWAPLDAEYVTATMRLARCDGLAVVNFWYVNELFAYLDYTSASAMTPSAAQDALAEAAATAIASGSLSPSGRALYAGLTGTTTPATIRRGARRP